MIANGKDTKPGNVSDVFRGSENKGAIALGYHQRTITTLVVARLAATGFHFTMLVAIRLSSVRHFGVGKSRKPIHSITEVQRILHHLVLMRVLEERTECVTTTSGFPVTTTHLLVGSNHTIRGPTPTPILMSFRKKYLVRVLCPRVSAMSHAMLLQVRRG